MKELNTKEKNNSYKKRIQYLLSELKSLIVIVFIVCLVKSVFVANYTVPTGSMKTTIEPGDKLIVSKMYYRIRFPFTTKTLFEFSKPKRGDVAVFIAPDEIPATSLFGKIYQFIFPLTYVKRLIGIPGDRIEVIDGFIKINGEEIKSELTDEDKNRILFEGGSYKETILEKTYNVRRLARFPTGEIQKWTIPEGHYFAVGDNRDQSSDSRAWNFIPEDNFLGKAKFIYLSLDWPSGILPKRIRTERFGIKF